MSDSLNRAWEAVFERFQLDPAKDLLYVTASQLNEVRNVLGSHDARLMVKFDSSAKMPAFLKKHGYFILPVSNGKYALVRGEGFHKLEQPLPPVQTFSSRLGFDHALPERGGESAYIDYAFNTGLVEHHYGIHGLHLTVRGRRRATEPFTYRVGSIPLTVRGVQIELDAGYESAHDFAILEAKVGLPADFHIRQLFYPYRTAAHWKPGKTVRPTFFVYEPQHHHFVFWDYEFTEPEQYGALRLKRQRRYSISSLPGDRLTLKEVAHRAEPQQVTQDWALIPQADDFDKVAQLPFYVDAGVSTSKAMARAFDFDPRQSSYYRQAAEALGLVVLGPGNRYALTSTGRSYVSLPVVERSTLLAALILSLPVMRALLDRLTSSGITASDIVSLLLERTHLNSTTARRRSHTLRNWLAWVQQHVGIVQVVGERILPR